MKISQEEKAAINNIVKYKLLESQVRGSAIVEDGGMVDAQELSEAVVNNDRTNEAFDAIINEMFDRVTDVLITNVSRSMSKLTESTSVDDVKMFVDNGGDQIDEVTEEVMTVIKSLLESYSKAFVAVVAEVANSPSIEDIIGD